MTSLIARTFYRFAGGKIRIPVTLGLRNIYILPTRYGLLFIAVLGTMLAGSINYNNNLGFLLTFLLGSLGLTAMLHTYATLFGLRLESATAVPVFAGQPVEVVIALAAVDRQRKGLVWYFDAENQALVDLSPGKVEQVTVSAATVHRGVLDPGLLRIASEYPLGLFRAWTRIDTGLRCLVYPQPISAPLPPITITSLNSGNNPTGTTGVDDFQGLTVYQPGDPVRRIHWQAYSRGRGLHIKTFAGQAGSDLMLDLAHISGDDTERKIGILSFHVLRAHHQRLRFALQLADRTISVGSGRVHRDRCLRMLALYGSQ